MFRSRPATLLDRTCCKNASRSGPWISSRPMWDTSNRLQKCRVYRCSATIPVGYWTGISHPPKSTMEAPGRHMGLVQLGAFEFAHVPSSLSCLFRCLFRLFCSVCFVCPVAGHIPDASWTGLGGALDTFRKGFGRTKGGKTAFGSFAPPFLYLRDSPPERVAPSACGQAALFGVSSWSDPFA